MSPECKPSLVLLQLAVLEGLIGMVNIKTTDLA